MDSFDYIIVGAGSAGCVLANRLSHDPRRSVLLIEAGPPDRHPFIHMPKGMGKLLFNPAYIWHLSGAAGGGRNTPETWALGRTLGGSSSVNGMVYVRGQPQDYDDWVAGGAIGWGWREMGAAFKAIENHELGAGEWRGNAGPLRVTIPEDGSVLNEAIIAAGISAGLPRKRDLNDLDQEGIGYLPSTIYRGRRWSAAKAFLNPARKRSNLHIVTGTEVDRVLFDGQRATGVACRGPQGTVTYTARREIILSAGAIHSPKLLQLSGIGPAALLRSRGVEVRADSSGVGANLREHRSFTMQVRFDRKVGLNHRLRGAGLIASVLQYYLLRKGPMAGPAFDIGWFMRSRPDVARPDIQVHAGAPTITQANGKMIINDFSGMRVASNVMRPESQGTVEIRSADARDKLDITPNFMSAPYDQAVSIDMVHAVRHILAQPPLMALGLQEQPPTESVRNGDEIVNYLRESGGSGHHLIGTCRMGQGPGSVVDQRLRVNGVSGLRVLDCSVMPTFVSGNTNAAAMAMAWHGADLILEDNGI